MSIIPTLGTWGGRVRGEGVGDGGWGNEKFKVILGCVT